VSDDLSRETLASLLPDRELRTYPALLSTDADARAWARADGPDGAVVVADYQASPRGRGGLPWSVRPGEGLGFSMVLRPDWAPEREGWLYSVAASAIADVLDASGEDAVGIRWPDEVVRGTERLGAIGGYVELGPADIQWVVVTVLIDGAVPPRGPLLAELTAAIGRRATQPAETVLEDYRARCVTLDTDVRARLVPLGPAAPEVVGRAVDLRADGSLVIELGPGRRMAVPPQNLGVLEAG
jgi:BirA family biotin operon repressor/biotin-[acetyl-CoA-carboxylase] ligase